MSLPTKIPATVVTGFLGAGKTTLIRHLIENSGGRRFAFVINEFGDLGVDSELIKGCGMEDCTDDDIVELTNGCICCTVADDFLPTIQALIDRDDPPEHIVIETSGLALPKPLVKAFTWPEVRSRVTVDGVVAVIDGRAVADGRFADDPDAVQAQREADDNLDHENPLEEVFEEQISCADMIIVNKTDLLDDAGLDAVNDAVTPHRRQTVKMVSAKGGAVDPLAVLGLSAAAEDDLDSRPSQHDDIDGDHDHDDFDTFTLALGPIIDPEALEDALKRAVADHDVLRIKGFLDIPGKTMRHVVQGVGGRFARHYDRPWGDDEARRSELVVIGLKGLDRDAIAAAIGHGA